MTYQRYMAPKTRTASITLSPRNNGWLCQIHYRSAYLGEVWSKSALEALTHAENYAVRAGFTHAKLTERGRDGGIRANFWNDYRIKLNGTALFARWHATAEA